MSVLEQQSETESVWKQTHTSIWFYFVTFILFLFYSIPFFILFLFYFIPFYFIPLLLYSSYCIPFIFYSSYFIPLLLYSSLLCGCHT